MIFSIGVIVVLILSMGMSCFIFMWQKDKKKVTRTSKVVGKVHEIYIYPIKSCAGIKVHSANVTSSGLAYGEYCSDRAWAIVREGTIDTSEKAIAHNINCTVMTIRQLSKMVLVQPSFNTDSSNESMFKVVKKVARCTVPTVNPHTGIKDTKFKLLNLLKKLRAQRYPHIPKESPYYSPEAMFGVNINLTDSGEAKIGSNLSQPNTIHTGDTIFVDEWNENPLPFLTGAMNPFTQ